MYTFGENVAGVATLVQRDQDTSYLVKIERWINMGQVVAYNLYDYWQELETPLKPFVTVQGQETYYMPSNFDKPTRIYDYTNNRKLTIITRQEYSDANIATLASQQQGTSQYAMMYGVNAINVIPTLGFMVQVKSSNLTDTSNCVVRVEGWLDINQSILGYTDITISSAMPTTYVTDPNATIFYGITRVTKSLDTNGYISLATQAGIPVVIATVAPVDRESRYPVLYLGLIPSGSFTYQILYKRTIKKMVNSNDYPFADISDFLHLYALGWALSEEKETVERATQIWTKANELIESQIRNQMNKMGDDFQHKMVPLTSQTHRF